MKLEEVKRLYLHSEIIQPDLNDKTFKGKVTASPPISMDRRAPVRSAAFLASQLAVKKFKPIMTNHDVDSLTKTDIANVGEAHRIAFFASEKAVELVNLDELILPL